MEAYPSTIKIAKTTLLIHQHLPRSHITFNALESLIGKLSFLGQFHSVLKLALHPLYQIMHHHEVITHSVQYSQIPMATVAPHLLYILSIFQLNLPGAFKRQINSRYFHISQSDDIRHIVTDASGHLGYAFVTSNGAH